MYSRARVLSISLPTRPRRPPPTRTARASLRHAPDRHPHRRRRPAAGPRRRLLAERQEDRRVRQVPQPRRLQRRHLARRRRPGFGQGPVPRLGRLRRSRQPRPAQHQPEPQVPRQVQPRPRPDVRPEPREVRHPRAGRSARRQAREEGRGRRAQEVRPRHPQALHQVGQRQEARRPARRPRTARKAARRPRRGRQLVRRQAARSHGQAGQATGRLVPAQPHVRPAPAHPRRQAEGLLGQRKDHRRGRPRRPTVGHRPEGAELPRQQDRRRREPGGSRRRRRGRARQGVEARRTPREGLLSLGFAALRGWPTSARTTRPGSSASS